VVRDEGVADCENIQHIDRTSQERPKEIMDDGSSTEKQKDSKFEENSTKFHQLNSFSRVLVTDMPAKSCTSNQAVYSASRSSPGHDS